ncbi:unnamed protein product [Bursaphelenchus okinawaensis]|uniref:G_PROTEIN_RECEP_F1_2 domain-containing protein n=1 Tax=Bursaphelenchus okinawaensis TaxID=465554 RepID=A0A811KBM5_9BILA|nr:unnamed protein product [Bursaphelenchus okinawaensis]CAG9097523.1 unnamed protein product [Bursaphelenchus okinawaensis]
MDNTLFINKFLLFNDNMSLISGVVGNIILIYLLKTQTSKLMKHYARLLILHCITDLLYLIIGYVQKHEVYAFDGVVFMTINGLTTSFSKYVSGWITTMSFYMEMMELAMMIFDFFYRYNSICRNYIMSDRQLYTSVTVIYIVVFIQAVPPFRMSQVMETEYHDNLLRQYLGYVPYYCAAKNTPFDRTMVLSSTVLTNLFCVFCFMLVLWKINRFLKVNRCVVKSTRSAEIEKQITRLFLVQNLIPIFVLSIPLLCLISFAFFGFNFVLLGKITRGILCWTGAAKSLAAICVTPTFRRTFCEILGFEVKRRHSVFSTQTRSLNNRRVSDRF